MNEMRWQESILKQLMRKVHLNSSTLAQSVTPQASLLGYHEHLIDHDHDHDQVGEIMVHRLRTCDVRLQAKTR